MKFTRTYNIVLCSTVLFIVSAMTYNQIQTTGIIDIYEIGKVLIGAIPAVLSVLAHGINPDGTSAKMAYDPTREN